MEPCKPCFVGSYVQPSQTAAVQPCTQIWIPYHRRVDLAQEGYAEPPQEQRQMRAASCDSTSSQAVQGTGSMQQPAPQVV